MVELHGIMVISFRVIIYKCLFANFFFTKFIFQDVLQDSKGIWSVFPFRILTSDIDILAFTSPNRTLLRNYNNRENLQFTRKIWAGSLENPL